MLRDLMIQNEFRVLVGLVKSATLSHIRNASALADVRFGSQFHSYSAEITIAATMVNSLHPERGRNPAIMSVDHFEW